MAASKLIKVTIRSNYGTNLAYPANDLGAMMCQLMGTKTFPDWGVNILGANGYKFEIVTPASI